MCEIPSIIGNDGSFEAAGAVEEVCKRSWLPGTEVQVVAVHEVTVPLNADQITDSEESYRLYYFMMTFLCASPLHVWIYVLELP